MFGKHFNSSFATLTLLTLFLFLGVAIQPARKTHLIASAAADGRVAEDRGAMGLGLALRRLGVVASVLHTGAHPDDEDSGLLSYLARGRQARTAYLSLTRGDGGQNVIGPELYEQLGVIRTEELLAARRLDGATQFFSRAFDFGFSKSRTETLSKWDREQVLSDMVRVIRTFRPLVIVSAWSGTPNDGHGHHQSAGMLTREAYAAAADPRRFPEQIKGGLLPWQAKKLYIRSFDGAASPRDYLPTLATLSINTGSFDPLLGRGYYEIAAQGRSQHRSQDEGTIEARGPRYSRLRLIDSKIGPIKNETDIFQDLDTSITSIASPLLSRGDAQLEAALSQVKASADEALRAYNPSTPGSISPILVRGLEALGSIHQRLRTHLEIAKKQIIISLGQPREQDLLIADSLLTQKEDDFKDALAKSQNVVVDCLTDDEIVTPGQSFTVSVSCYADAPTTIQAVNLSLPSGWTVVQGKQQSATTDGRLVSQTEFKVTVATEAEPTSPYWLKMPRKGDMFVVSDEDANRTRLKGIEPIAPPVIQARVVFGIQGKDVEVSQPAQYRYADRAVGEIRRDLKVATAISITSSPELLVFPVSNAPQERDVVVSVVNNSKQSSKGSVQLNVPSGWRVEPANGQFDLTREGERAAISFKVTAPRASSESQHQLSAVATVGDKRYEQGYQALQYPHIESRFFYRRAAVDAEIIDVKVGSGLKVGYIEGAGDDFANALRRINIDVKTIDSKELASGDLSVYDTIVSGVRAYEVRPDLVANNSRLLDFVSRGGTYITQYNRGNFETAGYGPYRFSEPNPPGRTRQREVRILYVAEADLAGALAPRAGKSPSIGFLGANDDPSFQALNKAGVKGTLLGEAELKEGSLGQYDVIVIGSQIARAPQSLREYNTRLLDYSRDKLVIIAYSNDQYVSGDFPNYPKPEARPFRTTDETASVTILDPGNPRFNYPNKITSRDFDGWVQERGAYFLGDWDPRYKPTMSCHDPGEPDLKGGEVIAEYGKGIYVYSAYAWFRELPKGVPGSYRLIANLVNLSKVRAAGTQSR